MLLVADADYQMKNVPPDALINTVDRIGKLKVEIFSDEHPPPHFRVSCDQGSNDFTISDCSPLHGDALRRFFPQIRQWHANKKASLIEAWDRLRPSDCPVGKYRE